MTSIAFSRHRNHGRADGAAVVRSRPRRHRLEPHLRESRATDTTWCAYRAKCGGGDFADSTLLRQHGPHTIEGNFLPGGMAKHQLKDCRTAIRTAQSLDRDLPVSKLVESLYEDMIAHGDGEIDHSGLYREL